MLRDRIPFDSLTLATVRNELADWIGARVQQASQPDDHSLVLSLYQAREAWLLLSWHPEFARVHFTFRKPVNQPQPLGFLQAVRAHLAGARLEGVEQAGCDRVLRLRFSGRKGSRTLLLEAMGKHSNLMLLDESDKILAAAKVVGRSKSRRPVVPGHPYSPPPFEPRPSLLEARTIEAVAASDGGSPFLVRWLRAHPGGPDSALAEVRSVVAHGRAGFLSPGRGAYPVDVSCLGWESFGRSSISVALDQHFGAVVSQWTLDRQASAILGQLRRALEARRAGLQGARGALQEAEGAARLQEDASLLLAYGPLLEPGASEVEVLGPDGEPRRIQIDPDAGWLGTAERMFSKARRLKEASDQLRKHIAALETEVSELEQAIDELCHAERMADVEAVQERAIGRRWLAASVTAQKRTEERPFEGKKVREAVGPGGVVAYVGLNAEANDYVTTRLAKPNDLWLHVRGSTSAHVVIPTQNRPERISKQQLLWAARLAVEHSASRHSGLVPVDYTLRKYVRKPKGSPPGTALYTHEKTLHVEREKPRG
ncbi:MAG: NFACT family protein [Fimbriimonadales bacterium]|nr:NFACT family protein [Fimbriimonadales bacterium]